MFRIISLYKHIKTAFWYHPMIIAYSTLLRKPSKIHDWTIWVLSSLKLSITEKEYPLRVSYHFSLWTNIYKHFGITQWVLPTIPYWENQAKFPIEPPGCCFLCNILKHRKNIVYEFLIISVCEHIYTIKLHFGFTQWLLPIVPDWENQAKFSIEPSECCPP